MATTVRVITQEAPAIVLSYPRDGDPVAGEALTDLAQLPPHFEQAFTLNAGFDLLIAELPFDPAQAGEAAGMIPVTLPGEVVSEAA